MTRRDLDTIPGRLAALADAADLLGTLAPGDRVELHRPGGYPVSVLRVWADFHVTSRGDGGPEVGRVTLTYGTSNSPLVDVTTELLAFHGWLMHRV